MLIVLFKKKTKQTHNQNPPKNQSQIPLPCYPNKRSHFCKKAKNEISQNEWLTSQNSFPHYYHLRFSIFQISLLISLFLQTNPDKGKALLKAESTRGASVEVRCLTGLGSQCLRCLAPTEIKCQALKFV